MSRIYMLWGLVAFSTLALYYIPTFPKVKRSGISTTKKSILRQAARPDMQSLILLRRWGGVGRKREIAKAPSSREDIRNIFCGRQYWMHDGCCSIMRSDPIFADERTHQRQHNATPLISSIFEWRSRQKWAEIASARKAKHLKITRHSLIKIFEEG